jgi:hypothetical protein
METTEPLMQNVAQLRSTPGKEVTGIQMIRTFRERQVQPLATRTHCMWDYLGSKDPTRISSDELKEIKIDDGVRAISVLTKKTDVPKEFGTEPFSKAHPQTEVYVFLEHPMSARIGSCICCCS